MTTRSLSCWRASCTSPPIQKRVTLRVGDRVAGPAGRRARYEAPCHARMLYVYDPSDDGHATIEGTCEELNGPLNQA